MILEIPNPAQVITTPEGLQRVETGGKYDRKLTRQEAAQFLSLSVRSFDTLRKHEPRKLAHTMADGRMWFAQSDLQRWMFGHDS